MITWLTAGESHGPALNAFLAGVPAGINITSKDIKNALARRRLGYGRGPRQLFESDILEITSGIRHGVSLGSPIALRIGNSEWPKWQAVMSADEVDPKQLLIDAGSGDEREIARNKPLSSPRPGHGDLAGMLKYDQFDARNILERASARETAARVALGAIAEAFLQQSGNITLVSHVVRIGEVALPADSPRPDFSQTQELDDSPVRCLDPVVAKAMIDEIDSAKSRGDTLGGVVEVIVNRMPIGLGSYHSGMSRLDAQLAGEVMSIQAVKGVEIGDGFELAKIPGSLAHDEIVRTDGVLTRKTNHAGGIEAGMSNGQNLIVRAAFKPISTVPKALSSIDMNTGETTKALHQRSDTTAVVPGAVIVQAQVALVVARALLEETGGSNLKQVRANLESINHHHQQRMNFND